MHHVIHCFTLSIALCAAVAVGGIATPQTAEEARATFDAGMDRANASIQAIIAVPDGQRTFANTIDAIDAMHSTLDRDVSGVLFMAYVHPDRAIREVGQQGEQEYSAWAIDLGKNEVLYAGIRSFADSNPLLDSGQQRLLDRTLRGYRRSGMALTPEARAELTAVQKELSEREIEFDQAINNDETMVALSPGELDGMTDDYMAALQQADGMYMLGMDYPTVIPVLDYCSNESTRQKIWLARKRRGGKANVARLEEILKLRARQAELLGYDTAADYETEVRMAKSGHAVAEFYERLRPLVRKKAALDFSQMQETKRRDIGNPNAALKPWDFGYYMERMRLEHYAVDSQAVQEYFPIEKVKAGLFGITQSLYGIEYRRLSAPADAPFWHEDVEWYEVIDTSDGRTLGEFYMDLHPRENKYGHAAQWGLHPRRVGPEGEIATPVAGLVCNFTKPTADKPSLLTHDEAETFFHEFGHCLHTILTESQYATFAGTSVERDFVEAPSQMFEHWVWDPDVLATFTGHYETDEPIPADMLAGMIAAKDLCSGMLAEGQICYGMTDQAYHTAPGGEVDTTQVGLDMYGDVTMFTPIDGTWFQASFGHLTGYQAGYYGYLWSQVYAEDMFQRFEELGMLEPEAGAYYRDHILAVGGTMDGMDMVTTYLGREPSMDPFLRSLGLDPDSNASP